MQFCAFYYLKFIAPVWEGTISFFLITTIVSSPTAICLYGVNINNDFTFNISMFPHHHIAICFCYVKSTTTWPRDKLWIKNISIYCSDGWTLKKYLIIYLILQQDIFFKFHSKNIPKLTKCTAGDFWQWLTMPLWFRFYDY